MKSVRRKLLPERSAWDDFRGVKSTEFPTLAVVVPLFNERADVESLLDEVLAQDYPAVTEIWLVDGGSTDGTNEVLRRLKTRDPRLRLLHNPRRNQAAALNLVLAQSQAELISRFDAHAHYTPDVLRLSVAALLRTGAGAVGAIMRPLARNHLISQSIAAAHQNRYGMGVAKFHQESAVGWVDTVWSPCYWKYILDRAGGLREEFTRTEDNDLHARIRACGYGLWLAPEIRAYYYPRESLRALWKQHFANGSGVVQTLALHPQAISLRHLVPFGFVFSVLVLSVLSVFRPAVTPLLLAELGAYVAALVFFSAVSWLKRPGRYALLLPPVFLTMHLSYGLGSLCRFLSIPFGGLFAPVGGTIRRSLRGRFFRRKK